MFSNQKYLKIHKPKFGSIEFVLKDTPYDFCFVDIEVDKFLTMEFYMNVVFNSYLRSKWSSNFSGIFFIKRMEPLYIFGQD
jgi:hypothetical protein